MADPRVERTPVVKDPAPSMEDRMKALEASFAAKLAEAEARAETRVQEAETRVREIEERAEKSFKQAIAIEDYAKAQVVAAEAAAKVQIEEARRIVVEATSPAVSQKTPRVSARSKEDVDCLCLKTQTLGVRAGGQAGRTYIFTKDEVISMDPSHAVEYEASGWVKQIKRR